MATVAQQTIEGNRQTEQTRLDSFKTAAERNKWGQFATPFALALSLARYANKTLGEGRLRFLDPAVGTGSFYSALSQVVPAKRIEAATGIELDPLFAEAAKNFWGKGAGQEATRLAIEYGFYRLNLQRIDLGVFAEHASAVRCYEKVGFQVEGRLRQDLFHGGEYKDRLWMGLLRSEYKRAKTGKKK